MHDDDQTLVQNQVCSDLCLAALACVVLFDLIVPMF